MIADLKPYPVMKDSGVPWLGEVPEHWALRRTKTLLRERSQKGFPDEPLLAATQTKGVVRKEEYENRTVLALKDLHLLKLVRVGDFVISLRSFQGGIEYARAQGIISPAYTILYPVEPEMHGFLVRTFKSKPYIENLSLFLTGIRQGQNVDYQKLSRSELPLPPAAEQSAIARFLDHVDRRLRRYIRAKQKLIALLHEQRQAIIHRAVTRGLDPDVPLKPSGVEWLGDVPEHWAVTSVRRLVSLITSGSRGWAEFYNDEGDLFIQSGNLGRAMALDLQRVQRVRVPRGAEGQRTKVARGDVLLCITGALTGNVAFVSEDLPKAYVNQHIALLRPDAPAIVPRFLAYALHSPYAQAQFKSTEYGGTKQGLGLGEVRDTFVLVPSREEQRDIVARLDLQCGHIMDSTDQVRREISLLREYRTRLISDVVTGKLDVREAAAHLPEETGEPEPFDETDTLAEVITEETEAPDPDALEEAEA